MTVCSADSLMGDFVDYFGELSGHLVMQDMHPHAVTFSALFSGLLSYLYHLPLLVHFTPPDGLLGQSILQVASGQLPLWIPCLVPGKSAHWRNELLPLKLLSGNSLVVQWLGVSAFTAMALGSIPGWGTKIPQATQCNQINK